MQTDDRNGLIAGMDARRHKAAELIANADIGLIVHADSGWTVKDLVGHLSTWEAIAADCIEAANRGLAFSNPDYERLGVHGYNHMHYERRRDWAWPMILQEWQHERTRLKQAILATSPADWAALIIPPWGGGEPVATREQIAKGMGQHEKRHLEEILSAGQLKQG